MPWVLYFFGHLDEGQLALRESLARRAAERNSTSSRRASLPALRPALRRSGIGTFVTYGLGWTTFQRAAIRFGGKRRAIDGDFVDAADERIARPLLPLAEPIQT